METGRHSIVSQLSSGETGEIEVQILGAFGVQTEFQVKSFQLEGRQKMGHPAWLTASGAFSTPGCLTSLPTGRFLSHLIHQWIKISSPTLWLKSHILSLAQISKRAFKMLQPK